MVLENDSTENPRIPFKKYRIGTIGVLRVCEELLGFGYMPFLIIDSHLDIGTDIMLQNRIAIQVKTTSSSMQRTCYDSRTIEYNPRTIQYNDFLIVWLIDYNFYIIPVKVLPIDLDKRRLSTTFKIGTKCKWDKYIDRWDLLGEPIMQSLIQSNDKVPQEHKLDEF